MCDNDIATRGRSRMELMAPAGNFESLRAAAQGGADSVYFGVGRLNMRAKSTTNFTVDDLPEVTALCREVGMRSYLTINTIIYDDDLADMRALVDAAVAAQVTAIIATDIATMEYAARAGAQIHASTQLNISNIEAVRFYARWCDVMVLARELTLEQIAHITRQIDEQDIRGPRGERERIEIFAHGALCMAVSGKCYLSLHESGASANRGECRQICRRSYTVRETESGEELAIDNAYVMSPKDLCTIGFLDRIAGAGVSVLKIEGRARAPEYVKTVCKAYNQALDALADGSYSPQRIEQWTTELATVFNRGFWGGYYLGKRLGEWSETYGSAATRHKTYVAKVTNYYAKIGVAELKMESGEISVGQPIMAIGKTTGVYEFTALELRDDLQAIPKATKGQVVSVPVEQPLRRGDRIYIFE